jgi:hypothetical protein
MTQFRRSSDRRRKFAKVAFSLACLFVAYSVSVPGEAATVGPYTRIEQDWEISINAPDAVNGLPQIDIELLPDPVNYPEYGGIVLINYQDTPNYIQGGIQAQAWNSDVNLGTVISTTTGTLSSTQKWTITCYIEITGGKFNYGIMKGATKQWGDLAKQNMNISVPTTLVDCNNYQTSNSMLNSGVITGTSYVTSIKLMQVRKFDAKGTKIAEAGQQLYP